MRVFRLVKLLILVSLLIPTHQVSSQVPSLPARDDTVYSGYYWGAAGIIDGLLTIHNSTLTTQTQKDQIESIVESAISGIWDARLVNLDGEKVASWRKTPAGDIYPSKKYGAAGIITGLLKAYEQLDNPLYLNYSEQAIQETYNQAGHWDLPHWAYAYPFTQGQNGIFITDQAFGSMGIIESTLEIYDVTRNPAYLQMAIDASNWVYNISYPRQINQQQDRVVPWYESSDERNITYTSYMQGNAGIIPVLLDLESHTSNSTWTDWARFIGDWLVDQQSDEGAWNQTPFSLDPRYHTGFELGTAGVVTALVDLGRRNNTQQYDQSISRGLSWLQDQFISNTTYEIFPKDIKQESAFYGLYQGMAGINRLFRQVNLITPDIVSSYNWLLNEALYQYEEDGETYLGMYVSTGNENYVDLSYSYGLTGVMEELILAAEDGVISLDQNLIIQFLNTLNSQQLDSGLWPRQFEIERNWFENIPNQVFVISGLLLIGILVYIFRIRRRRKQEAL